MQVTSKSPVPLQFSRDGGSVITARLDFWRATPTGWQLAGSNLFQAVAQPVEAQQASLPVGSYSAVFTCGVEESINGLYDFEMKVGEIAIGAKKGDVDKSTRPHDSTAFKNQFVLVVN